MMSIESFIAVSPLLFSTRDESSHILTCGLRHQTVEYTVQLAGRDQDMRFRCFRGAHQLYRRHVRWHFHIHERAYTSSLTPIMAHFIPPFSPNGYKAPSTPSNLMSGPLASHLSNSHSAAFHLQSPPLIPTTRTFPTWMAPSPPVVQTPSSPHPPPTEPMPRTDRHQV